MKCLMKYQWVKLPRNHLPEGKGIMNAWAKLASRAAFRKGQASYCGHINAVSPGMWSGGVVGLKSILGSRSRVKSLEALSKLSELGYISYSLNAKTKKLTYQITDWVIKCSGEECMDGTVYATEGYGFLCLPRNITDRLVEQQYIFDEADAWLDLWCHTVSEDPDNAFSFLGTDCSIWQVRCRTDIGNPGTKVELGKNEGVAFLSKAWGCFYAASPPRCLRLPHFQ